MTVRISNSNQRAVAQVLRLYERRVNVLRDFRSAQRKMVQMDYKAEFDEEEEVLLMEAH